MGFISEIRPRLTHNLINIPGWHTRRKIVVIESDDWGSIRMPSKNVFDRLLRNGVRVDRCHYCSNDSIATATDLSLLFELLESVRDCNNNPAVITANAVVANPDFDAIKQSEFQEYSFVPINIGIPQIPDCERSLQLWKEGHAKGVFHLQSHGREHLNVNRWMESLRSEFPETLMAFQNGVYGISTDITSEKRKSYLPAFDWENSRQEALTNEIAKDGLRLFEKIFGFKSASFIAPNYKWGQSLEFALKSCGVKYIQGNQLNRYVSYAEKKSTVRLRRTGSVNPSGLIDLARNATFEPSENPNKDWVDACLAQISTAFRWKHPAIISAHRVNFVGAINPKNRDRGLSNLKNLLLSILKLWPDVEFMSSDILGSLISKNLDIR